MPYCTLPLLMTTIERGNGLCCQLANGTCGMRCWNLLKNIFYIPAASSAGFASLQVRAVAITPPHTHRPTFSVARQVCNLLIIPLDMLTHTSTHTGAQTHTGRRASVGLFRHFVIFNLWLSCRLVDRHSPSHRLLPWHWHCRRRRRLRCCHWHWVHFQKWITS